MIYLHRCPLCHHTERRATSKPARCPNCKRAMSSDRGETVVLMEVVATYPTQQAELYGTRAERRALQRRAMEDLS